MCGLHSILQPTQTYTFKPNPNRSEQSSNTWSSQSCGVNNVSKTCIRTVHIVDTVYMTNINTSYYYTHDMDMCKHSCLYMYTIHYTHYYELLIHQGKLTRFHQQRMDTARPEEMVWLVRPEPDHLTSRPAHIYYSHAISG